MTCILYSLDESVSSCAVFSVPYSPVTAPGCCSHRPTIYIHITVYIYTHIALSYPCRSIWLREWGMCIDPSPGPGASCNDAGCNERDPEVRWIIAGPEGADKCVSARPAVGRGSCPGPPPPAPRHINTGASTLPGQSRQQSITSLFAHKEGYWYSTRMYTSWYWLLQLWIKDWLQRPRPSEC